ncbi:PREDICTED: uncharacterized protein LOC107064106 [Polistes dominula]|uniref:Uncharacterized protein LOC107064106 n=1 Tax=Polistes dominula TaxID=743375 RepID=A0ABM1HVD9_POLDO|nr:PREDICTED: uncharacterized protein LOC107064106 [Polistes dominula]
MSRQNNSQSDNKTSDEGEAQNKFGSAKTINSDQYLQYTVISRMTHGNAKVTFTALKVHSVYHWLIILAQEILSLISSTASLSARFRGGYAGVIDLNDDVRKSVH